MNEPLSPLTLTETERRRLEEVDALATRGVEALPRLLPQLTDPSWVVRRAVVAAVAALGDLAVDRLADLLRTRRDDETRIAAVVDALVASVGHVDEAALRLTLDADPAVVADAASILGRRRSGAATARLVELMQHESDNVAVAATEALGRIGGRAAVDALVAAVQSANFFRAFPAIDVLGRSGDPRAVGPLVRLLDHSHYAAEACRALGRTAERGAIPPLVELLVSPSDATVRIAAQALAELRDKYRQRHGATTIVDETIRRAAEPASALRRLADAVAGADPPELLAITRLLGTIGTDAAVPVLTRLLDVAGAADAAAEALGALGQRAAEFQVLKALREGDSARRRSLLPTIASPSGADDVVACLSDPDATVRALACDALARVGAARVVRAIFRALQDADPRVVQAATAAVQSLGSRETEALALEAAKAASPVVRRAALRILSYFGHASAFPTFEAALRDADGRVRDTAIQGLPFIEDARALDLLLGLARGEDEAARATAMRALGQCPSEARVVAALLRGLTDRAAWVRYYATQSLGRLQVADAAEAIGRLVHDPAGQVRVAAIEALSHLPGPTAHQALREAAQSDDPDLRRAGIIGLGLGKRPDAVPILLAATATTDAPTRLVALSALAEFHTPSALTALARAASDPDPAVRTAAFGYLASAPGLEATRVLVDFLGDEAGRDQVLEALSTPTEERVPGLLSMLEHADEELAPWLTAVLARLSRPDATAALHQTLRSPNAAARKAAAESLAGVGTTHALRAVRSLAETDPDPEVRRVCQLLVTR